MKRIVVVSDLHVGSVWGLFPPKYEDQHGNTVGLNPIQKELWKHWENFVKKMGRKKIDVLLDLSENIDGIGAACFGREQVTTDLTQQQNAVAVVLKPLAEKAEMMYIVKGSDYHGAKTSEPDEEIAQKLGAKYLGWGPYPIEINGKILNFSHGEGGVYWYRATKMDKIGFANLLASACNKAYKADIIVRGHYHFAAWLEYNYQSIVLNPCWQAQTDYMRKKDPFKFIPDIGGLEIEIKGNGDVSHRFLCYQLSRRPLLNVADKPKLEETMYGVARK